MNHNLEDSDASTYSVQGNTSLRFSYSVESDAIGNITYIDGIEIEWDGRRAVGVQQGDNTITYEYNIDGQRTKKTVNGVTTEYFYNGDILAGQKTGNDTIIFMYDNNGDIFGFEYNGTPYYYVKNAQNDVVMVFNSYDRTAVIYQYDAWGNITDVYDSTTQRVSNINPITYRSYYYDIEMGVYYLNSRYYAPVICRFISADGYVQTGQGVLSNNMFAYCMNNPVKFVDSNGESATIAGAIVGGLFGFFGALISEATDDNEGVRMDKVLACTLSGAATGAAIGFVADFAVATGGAGVGILASIVAGAGFSAANSAITQKILTDEVDVGKVIFDGIIGGIMGGICTGPSATNMTPLVSGFKEGIKHVSTQVYKEVAMFYFSGIIGSSLAIDISYTAITTFGAWYGSGLYDVMIGWCE